MKHPVICLMDSYSSAITAKIEQDPSETRYVQNYKKAKRQQQPGHDERH